MNKRQFRKFIREEVKNVIQEQTSASKSRDTLLRMYDRMRHDTFMSEVLSGISRDSFESIIRRINQNYNLGIDIPRRAGKRELFSIYDDIEMYVGEEETVTNFVKGMSGEELRNLLDVFERY